MMTSFLRRAGRIALLLPVLLLAACGKGGDTAPGTVTPTPSPTPTPTPAPKRVVFIGGSITYGSGASTRDKSWAALTSGWLNSFYPQKILAKNIAIGATTSQYGVYRLDRDLQGFVPDIAFIEFAMNDPVNKDFVYTNVDALVYKLRAKNPDMVIIYVATTRSANEAAERGGNEPDSSRLAREIATLDQVHFVDVGHALWNRIIAESAPYTNYLPDGLHPDDAGHLAYFETLRNDLAGYLPAATGTGAVSTYLNASGYENATIIPATGLSSTDCATSGNALKCTLGQGLNVDFSGVAIGFSLMISEDGGQMICTVDGDGKRSVNFWDKYSYHRVSREYYVVMYDKLPEGRHTLACTVNDLVLTDGITQSTGHTATITGILATHPQAL